MKRRRIPASVAAFVPNSYTDRIREITSYAAAALEAIIRLRNSGKCPMSVGVCVITAGLPAPSRIGELLMRCGVDVWTPDSPDADDGHIYDDAVCLVIDMPGDAGVRTLQLFREYSINTPALLIVDPGLERAFLGLKSQRLLSVLPRTADLRGALRWLEVMCRAKTNAAQSGDEYELMRA